MIIHTPLPSASHTDILSLRFELDLLAAFAILFSMPAGGVQEGGHVAKVEGTKYRRVLEAIRNQIVGGEYSSNRRLPPWSQIAEQHGVGMATVQKAVDTLTRDGFLYAVPGAGTYVADHLPNECRFALALHHESHALTSMHDSAVRNAANNLDNGTSIQFRQYKVSGWPQYQEEINRLSDDVVNNRLAGVISPFFCPGFDGTPILKTPGMPLVFCSHTKFENAYIVGLQGDSFIQRAMAHVRSRGRRRIAHLVLDTPFGFDPHAFEASLRQLDAEFRPYWIQGVVLGHTTRTASNMVRLLMELEGDKRPDALIVHDDALLEPVVLGLLSCNVRVPEDLEVVSLANFPSPRPQGLPVRRLGFDWHEMLSKSIEVIRLARQGHKPAPIHLPAVFEDELPVRAATRNEQMALHLASLGS